MVLNAVLGPAIQLRYVQFHILLGVAQQIRVSRSLLCETMRKTKRLRRRLVQRDQTIFKWSFTRGQKQRRIIHVKPLCKTVVLVVYERWQLTRGSNQKASTGKILMFWIGNGTLERLSITIMSNGKREFLQFPLYWSFTVHYFTTLVVSRKFLTIRIVLSCFVCSFSLLRNSQLESDVCCLAYI